MLAYDMVGQRPPIQENWYVTQAVAPAVREHCIDSFLLLF